MTTFEDGPAKGAVLMISRAPLLLRVVVNDAGEIDALDQLEDTPKKGERITCYVKTRDEGVAFLDGRHPGGKRWGMVAACGTYREFPHQPQGDDATKPFAWQAWARKHAEEATRIIEQQQKR